MATRDDVAQLRALAGERDYSIERAIMRGRWRLRDDKTGDLAVNRRGSAAFTITEAVKFLRALGPKSAGRDSE